MSSDLELIEDDEAQMSIQSNTLLQQKSDEQCSNINLDRVVFKSCARGKGIQTFFSHIGYQIKSSSIAYEEKLHNANVLGELTSHPTITPLKLASYVEQIIEPNHPLTNEPSLVVIETNQQSLQKQQLSDEHNKEHIVLSPLFKNSLNNLLNDHHSFSRLDIENEIATMIQGVLALEDGNDMEPLYIADCYCHFDVLFEKMHNPRQTIWQYLKHNKGIYNKGVDMAYVIQAFFGPHHIEPENWNNVYSNYLAHDVVYATCGVAPLLAHHYDLNMELNLRRALNHPKVIGLGEIGLDFESQPRPDDYVQISTFIQQLRLAKTKNLPIMLTSRNSFIETLQCISDELNNDYRIHWRNFGYGVEELEMLCSKMNNVYFGCSPQVLYNKKFRMIIENISIKYILPESVAPHLTIEECPHVWDTHPIFVIQVYRLLAQLFKLTIRQTTDKLVDNAKYFYKLK